MPESTPFSTEDRQALESFAQQLQADSEAMTQSAPYYDNAVITATASIGPSGGGMNGWITYTATGEKIYFWASKITSKSGLAALAGGQPMSGALPAVDLNGKTGTFVVSGSWGAAALQAWVDGKPVFRVPVPMTGSAPFQFELKGNVTFVRR